MVEPMIRDLSPPGEILEEALAERSMTQAEFARRASLSAKHVSQIVSGKASLTTEVALAFERVLSIPASFWVQLEFNHQSEIQRREESEGLNRLAGWIAQFPFRQMSERGWLAPIKRGDVAGAARALFGYFGVADQAALDRKCQEVPARLRASSRFKLQRASLCAWLRAGEREASRFSLADYDKRAFESALARIRSNASNIGHLRSEATRTELASTGVALVFVPPLPKLPVSGATKWMTPDRALIVMSMRHRSDDHLWFTFFHEACHVLRHSSKSVFVDQDDGPAPDDLEKEADAFARDILISPLQHRELVAELGASWDLAVVRRFAAKIGVCSGVVIGRLQHDRILPYNVGNKLKLRVDFAPTDT